MGLRVTDPREVSWVYCVVILHVCHSNMVKQKERDNNNNNRVKAFLQEKTEVRNDMRAKFAKKKNNNNIFCVLGQNISLFDINLKNSCLL